MRDKYIELIINYVKEKPGYEAALDDIKKEVLALGATEGEFDEAIKKITGPVQNPLTQKSDNVSTDFIAENTIQPEFTKTNKPIALKKLLEFAKKAQETSPKKRYVAVIAFLLIIAISASQLVKLNDKPKNALIAQNTPSPVTKSQKSLIPVVYASSYPIDAEKIFSIKSTNIQLTVTGKPKKEVMGFFPYWMLSKYDDIALNTLTSISLFGLETDAKGNIITQGNAEADGGWAMWKDPLLDKFIAKAKIHGLKINLAIKCFKSGNIEGVVASDASQKNLIANILYLVNSKDLDGVNIDFEYVGNPSEATRNGFTRFITNLNAELKRQNPNSSLTIDTYLASGADKGIFDIPALALNSDAFIIMGYDMHTPNGEEGAVAAMGGETNIIGYVQNFLEKVDPSKIILAVPYYGYAWPTNSSSGSTKVLPYAEIAQNNQNAQLTWNETTQTPSYKYKDTDGIERTVYFDNVRSLAIKYDFINKKNLKGVGIWALGYDGHNQDLEKLLVDKFINL